MQRKKAMRKRRFRLNTPAEEARIQAGIKNDPDSPELAPGQLVRMRPFRKWQAERRLGRPRNAASPAEAIEVASMSARISGVLHAARTGGVRPAIRRRQAQAGSGHQAGSGDDAEMGVMVMRKRKLFLVAVANVAKARGLSQVAKDSGLGRESLYKALKPGSKIRYETVRRLVDSLGVHLTVKAT
jgi:probable addiction module antidote protein